MKAQETMMLGFLQNSSQFIIPIYQRTYSWEQEQCQQLWDDIFRAGSNDHVKVHFVGSIVYIADGLNQVANAAPLLLIDGQQRLTTVVLLLAALKRALGDTEPVDGFSAEKIKTRYLTRHLEKDEKYFKLILSQNDASTLKSIILENELPQDVSLRIQENFDFFVGKVTELKNSLDGLCKGIGKLAIVDIALERGEDNPQLIFESMNSTGKDLSEADLIRNYILMALDPDTQTSLYEKYWRPMELDFGQLAYSEEFDDFMRHYLTVKLGEIPRQDLIYSEFKDYATTPGIAADGVEALVKDIRTFASYYCAMSLGKEQDEDIRNAFQDLKDFKVDVAYPFLLEVYSDHKAGMLDKKAFLEIISLVETYAFRRLVVQIPPNSMNKTFARFLLSVDKQDYLESVKAFFMSLTSYRRFPADVEFADELRVRDLYNTRNRSYWLRKLENSEGKELLALEKYSIEHIMPQNSELNEWWRQALGENWSETQARLLHTVGNLTLTRYNSEFSDRSFPEKRDLVDGGFKSSPLKLNEGLGSLETWNEEKISARADFLIGKALKVWPAPVVNAEQLAKVRAKVQSKFEYTYAEHKYLDRPEVFEIFKLLKSEVLSLDPSVYEEILKYYIAFKAETNFVDVITKASGLRLTLNMKFTDLLDPENRAVNLNDKGRLGNGDVSFSLISSTDVPYAMFLIRQAFDRQFEGN